MPLVKLTFIFRCNCCSLFDMNAFFAWIFSRVYFAVSWTSQTLLKSKVSRCIDAFRNWNEPQQQLHKFALSSFSTSRIFREKHSYVWLLSLFIFAAAIKTNFASCLVVLLFQDHRRRVKDQNRDWMAKKNRRCANASWEWTEQGGEKFGGADIGHRLVWIYHLNLWFLQ